jgi:protein involved in polysaccharide export with SLBB domain
MDIMTTSAIRRLRRLAECAVLAGLFLCLLAGMTGCRSAPPFGHGEAGKNVEEVKLRPGLVISMSVLVAGKKEIDEPSKRVSDGGTVVLPLLGEMEVADLTLNELQGKLTDRYKKYFIQPQVILEFVRDTDSEGISPWGFVTVLGRVSKPGRIAIPATRDMTVSGAIQKAGGFAPSAKDTAILVTRSFPNGKTEKRTINLRAVGTAGRLGEDIILEADDVVFVPEMMF